MRCSNEVGTGDTNEYLRPRERMLELSGEAVVVACSPSESFLVVRQVFARVVYDAFTVYNDNVF